jgi:hypothetical protein
LYYTGGAWAGETFLRQQKKIFQPTHSMCFS